MIRYIDMFRDRFGVESFCPSLGRQTVGFSRPVATGQQNPGLLVVELSGMRCSFRCSKTCMLPITGCMRCANVACRATLGLGPGARPGSQVDAQSRISWCRAGSQPPDHCGWQTAGSQARVWSTAIFGWMRRIVCGSLILPTFG